MNKIVVLIEGGVIQNIYGEGVQVYIADYDIDGYDPDVLVDVDGCKTLVYKIEPEKSNEWSNKVIQTWDKAV